MKNIIFTYVNNKRLYKLIINKTKIDIYKRIPKKNKYEKIDYNIHSYENIYFGYNLYNIKNEENGYITKNNSIKYTYQFNYNSIGSILILISKNPFVYIYIHEIIYLFIIDEDVLDFSLLHDVFGNNINEPYIISHSFLKTPKYTYNLNKYIYMLNEQINIDLHSYLNLRPYNDDTNEIIYENVYIKEHSMNKLYITELYTEKINNFNYDNLFDSDSNDDLYN